MAVPGYYPPVSLIVSHILDNLGVNEEIIQKRRDIFLQDEASRATCNYLLAKFCGQIWKQDVKIYHFGSQIEGATTKGLDSDKDLLYDSSPMINIVRQADDFCENGMNLLMKSKENTPQGHCFLQFPYAFAQIPPRCFYTKNGSVFYPNTICFQTPMQDAQDTNTMTFKHGPSNYSQNRDKVYALKISQWPETYKTMLNRLRIMIWPSDDLLSKIENTNIFLIPIGYADSEFSFLEWRISPSLAERMSIFSFNITQLRCLTLLKLIKKNFFEPEVGDCFTSYHCKTVMFYTIAKTPCSLWTNDNLLRCLRSCLFTLQRFLRCRFCPQFFNPYLNLFVGKMNPQAYRIILNLVMEFINSNLKSLLLINCDGFGKQLRDILNTVYDNSFGLNLRNVSTNDHIEIIVNIMRDRVEVYREYSLLIFQNMNSFTLRKICKITVQIMQELLKIIQMGNRIEQQATKSLIPFICAWLASFLASYRIKKKQPITEDIFNIYRIGFKTDAVSTRLKLASALVCAQQYDEAVSVIEEARMLFSNESQKICFIYLSKVPFDKKNYRYASELLGKGQCMMTFTLCVRFLRQEIWCCPLGFRWSVLEATCSNKKQFLKLQDREICPMMPPDQRPDDLLRIGSELDAHVLLCYLEFLIYREMKEPERDEHALHNLIRFTNEQPLEWEKYFFDIISRKTDFIVNEHNKLVYSYPFKETENVHIAVNPWTNEKIRKLSFGVIGLCVSNAFRKFSRVQHMDSTLIIVAYALESMGYSKMAYAFYWMAYLIEPSIAARRHLMRLQYFRKDFQMVLFLCSLRESTAEMHLLPHISYSLMSIIEECRLALHEEGTDTCYQQTPRQKAIRFCCYLATLIRNYKKVPNVRSTKKRSHSCLFLYET